MNRAKQLGERVLDPATKGFIAYANLQASYLRDIGQRFRSQWRDECNVLNLPEVEINQFVPVEK